MEIRKGLCNILRFIKTKEYSNSQLGCAITKQIALIQSQ